MASDERTPHFSPASGNPAEERTLAFEQSQTPSGKETIAGKTQGVETVKTGHGGQPSPAPAPTMESTVQQDELDVKSAVEHSVLKDQPPDVPGYSLEEKLGQGTYGVVWRAVEVTTNRQVAIKFFHRRVGEMWQIVWAEIKQLAMLDAVPGIVQLKDAEPDGEPPYFVMNYAEGGSLAGLLRKGAMPVAEALDIFRNMVESMAYVHAKGIRHCDLKPANILLDTLGKPLIADFGQAHLSMESQGASVNLGTFYYMAPEQADLTKQIPDTRWDVYGLGAIFYCMLTGQPPRASTELTGELNQTTHLNSRLKRYQEGVAQAPLPVKHRQLPGMDRSLAYLIERCLHLDPAKRYQSASEVLHALEHRESYLRKRPMLFLGLAASVLLIGCLGALAYTLVHFSITRTQAALEEQIRKNDTTTAKLMANVVSEELSRRKETMERLARSEKTLEKVQAFRKDLTPQNIADKTYLEKEGFKKLEEHLFKTYRKGFHLLIYYDVDGTLLAGGYPEPTWDESETAECRRDVQREALRKIYGVNYAYRDYYHGLGGDLPKSAKPKYVDRTYVSDPYVSTLMERGKHPTLVAVSTPVYEPTFGRDSDEVNPSETKSNKGKLLGVLIGYIYIEEFYTWLEEVHVHQGSAILLNQYGKCVYPSEVVDGKPILRAMPKTHEVVRANQDVYLEHHDDEITGCKCLASFAPMKEIGWGAVVLHYRDEVFQPIENLRWTLIKAIFVVSTICAALLAAVWFWLLRTMRGKDRLRSA